MLRRGWAPLFAPSFTYVRSPCYSFATFRQRKSCLGPSSLTVTPTRLLTRSFGGGPKNRAVQRENRKRRRERRESEERKAAAAEVLRIAREREANEGTVRLAKLMGDRGLCSRREGARLISQGFVLVDNAVAVGTGTRCDPNAVVTLMPKAQKAQLRKATVILYKPSGYVSGQAEHGLVPAIVLLTKQARVGVLPPGFPELLNWKSMAHAGRLDRDSTGLLVFTSDGRVAKKLLGNKPRIEKEYWVAVQGHYGDKLKKTMATLTHGVILDGQPLLPTQCDFLDEKLATQWAARSYWGRQGLKAVEDTAEATTTDVIEGENGTKASKGKKKQKVAKKPDPNAYPLPHLHIGKNAIRRPHKDIVCLRMLLTEGRKRQIRRMCAVLGLQVIGLHRPRIGNVDLGTLRPGQWMYINGGEF